MIWNLTEAAVASRAMALGRAAVARFPPWFVPASAMKWTLLLMLALILARRHAGGELLERPLHSPAQLVPDRLGPGPEVAKLVQPLVPVDDIAHQVRGLHEVNVPPPEPDRIDQAQGPLAGAHGDA